MYKLNENRDILNMMVKGYLSDEKKAYVEKNSKKSIPFNSDSYEDIAKILAEQTDGTGIQVRDIDKAVDEYLMKKNYAYENADGFSLSKQYVFKSEENYYYFNLIELNICGGARSVSEAMYSIAQETKRNARSIKRNSELMTEKKINISIVKNNSTKYLKDGAMLRVMYGSYDIETKNFSLNFNEDDMSNIYPAR